MNDYLSIKEFSELSGVETSKLRYWDEIGLFSPIMRNPDNNYRYYSLMQLLALNFVTVLSDLNIPLKTIADLREDRDPNKFLKLIDKQERDMDMEMRELRQRYSIIHAKRELINYGMRVDETKISILYREDKPLILWPKNEYKEGESFLEPLASLVKHTGDYHINLSFPVGGYFDNMETFMESPGKPQRFFSIDPIGTHIRKAGDYLIGFARGAYGDFGDLPERMMAYIKENSIKVHGPLYIIYLHEETCLKDPSQYLVQAGVAVSKKRK